MAKLLIFDFVCNKCGYQFEKLVDVEQRVAPCPHCESQSYRLIPATKGMPLSAGVDPDSSMAAKWDRAHAQKVKQELKQES